MDLFRSKYLRLVSICFLCIWFTMNLVYYGLILNMNALGGNIYVNSVSELDGAADGGMKLPTWSLFVVNDDDVAVARISHNIVFVLQQYSRPLYNI